MIPCLLISCVWLAACIGMARRHLRLFAEVFDLMKTMEAECVKLRKERDAAVDELMTRK